MKKASQLVFGLFILLLTTNVKAQSKAGPEFFAGKWNIVIKDVPGGDAKLTFVLEKKGDTLSGIVLDTAGVQQSKVDKIELKENEITLYFNIQGYDVNVLLAKKDDDHLAGKMMDMFETTGERVKAKLD